MGNLIMPLDQAAPLRQWLFDNYNNGWTLEKVNAAFNVSLSDNQLFSIYKGNFTFNLPDFSYFKAPVMNTTPTRSINLVQIYRAISGNYYKGITEKFRAMPPGKEKGEFKAMNFDHGTFAGTFSTRKAAGLITPSYYAVFDFDHVEDVLGLKTMLIQDATLSPELVFTSPSGDGLKVVVLNSDGEDYSIFYETVTKYLLKKYPKQADHLDRKTKDVSRTCFICHDPDCYLTQKLKTLCQVSKN